MKKIILIWMFVLICLIGSVNAGVLYSSNNLSDFDIIQGGWTVFSTNITYIPTGTDFLTKNFNAENHTGGYWVGFEVVLVDSTNTDMQFRTYEGATVGLQTVYATISGDNWFYNDGVWNSMGFSTLSTWTNVSFMFNDSADIFSSYESGALKTSNGAYKNTITNTETIEFRGVASRDGMSIRNFCIFELNSTYDDCFAAPAPPGANMSLSFFSESPANGTKTGETLVLNYTLSSVNTAANCSLYRNDTLISTQTGLGNGTFNFFFNNSYWLNGYNLLNISCVDQKPSRDFELKTLFVDDILPEIKYINYTEALTNLSLPVNLTIFDTEIINFTSSTFDKNNWLFNFTINRSGYTVNSTVFSFQVSNISKQYNFSQLVNMENFSIGWHDAIVTSKDAHTANKVDWDVYLPNDKVRNILKVDTMLGLDVAIETGGKVTNNDPVSDIQSLEFIQMRDRKKFDVTFKSNVNKFDMYVVGDYKVEYVKDSQYMAHFVIDDKYWYDLENGEGATISKVTKISDKEYKIEMNKPMYVDRIIFNSIGVLNSNSLSVPFYNGNYNPTFDNLLTQFNSSENLTLNFAQNLTQRFNLTLPRRISFVDAYLSINSDLNISDVKQNKSNAYNFTKTGTITVTRRYNFTILSSDLIVESFNLTDRLNLTVPQDCIGDDTAQIIEVSASGNNDIKCFNFTDSSDAILRQKVGGPLNFENIYWQKSSVLNFQLQVDDEADLIFNETGTFEGRKTSETFISQMNNIFPDCSCTNCIVTNTTCQVPFIATSDNLALVELNNLYLSYTFTPLEINVEIRDSDDKNLITGTNMTSQVVGNDFQDEKTTTTGLITFNFPFNSTEFTNISIRTFSTTNTDYSITIREFEVNVDFDETIIIYMTNTSDTATTKLVEFVVQDENQNFLAGATVQIFKQDPSTNTLLHITDLTTNPFGRVSTILETDSAFYIFKVQFESQQIFESAKPVQISLNDDQIVLIGAIEEPFSSDLVDVVNTQSVLTFTDVVENETGFFQAQVNSDKSIQSCLTVYIVNQTGNQIINVTCGSGTVTQLVSATLAPTNETTYNAILTADATGTGEQFFLQSLSKTLKSTSAFLDRREEMLVFIAPIVLSAFGFAFDPIFGVLIAMLLYVGIYFTGITSLTLSALSVILVIFIIVILSLAYKRRLI